jgi:protein TonB
MHAALLATAVGVVFPSAARQLVTVAELIAPEGPRPPAPDPAPPEAAAVATPPSRLVPTDPARLKPATPPVPKPVDARAQPTATVKPEEAGSAVREAVAEPAASEPAAPAIPRPADREQAAATERPAGPAQALSTANREAAPGLPPQLAEGGSLDEARSSLPTSGGSQKGAGGSGPAPSGDTAGAPSATSGAGQSSQGTGVARAQGGLGVTRSAIPRGGYQIRPPYPASARQQGIQGTALLRVYVDTDGRVTSVSVARSAGHADLDQAAADAVRQWRFEPGRKGDEPVGMWVQLPVEFRLK